MLAGRAPRGRAPLAARALAPAAAAAALLALLLAAALPAAAAAVTCNAGFAQLSLSYAAADKTTWAPGQGKSLNDKVLFRGVASSSCGGVTRQLDALVTTKTLSGARVLKYEDGTHAGGADSHFQVDLEITANQGFGEFHFEFFMAGSYGQANQTAATLRNVKISAIDVDDNQFCDMTGILGYTWATDTRLRFADGTKKPPSSFPFSPHFQGGSSATTNSPRDRVIVTYGEINQFSVSFGRKTADPGKAKYFGIAFTELGWGSATTEALGTNYTVTYGGNGATSGVPPPSVTAVVGAPVAVAGNTLLRPGYTFTGWNTASDGSGFGFAPGNATYMPYLGATLYAQWVQLAPQAITARDDTYHTVLNQPFSPRTGQSLLANDSSPNPSPQLEVTSYGLLSDPAAGTLGGFPDGSFLFTPTSGWIGTVKFVYTMTDKGTGLTATATATVFVDPPGQAPVAADDSYACPFGKVCSVDAAQGLLANDTSPTGADLSILGSPTPSEGTLAVNSDGSFDWTPPNATFIGTVTFTYTVQDSGGYTAAADVTLVVAAPPPVADDDSYKCPFGQVCSVTAAQGLLANDTSPAGLALTVVGTPTPSKGAVVVSPDGSFVWTPPNSTFSGMVTFRYTVQDSAGNRNAATVTIVVLAPAPVVPGHTLYTCTFGQHSCSVDAAHGLLANGTSPAGLPLTVVSAPTPSKGTLVVNPDGSFDWTPPSSTFSGTVTLTYTVQDSAGNQATATVTIVVPPPRHLVGVNVTCTFGQSCKVPSAQGLLPNDTWSAGLNLTVVGAPTPSEGTVVVNPDGSFDWTPPNTTFSGTVTLTYTVQDTTGNQATATVTIVVLPPGHLVTCPFGQICKLPSIQGLLANDTSSAGLNLTVVGTPTPSEGTVVVNADGSFDWMPPNSTFSGTFTLTYTVQDSAGNQKKVTVTVVVPPPRHLGGDVTCPFGQICKLPSVQGLLANDTSSARLNLTVVGTPTPSEGTVVVNADGSFDWMPPNSTFSGTFTLTYTVQDSAGNQEKVTVTVVVPPPRHLGGDVTCPFGQICKLPSAQGLLANDTSSAGLNLTVVGAPTPSEGTVVVNADGSFDWMPPNSTFSGAFTLTYTVQDSAGNQGAATVTIVVLAPAPVAGDDLYTCITGQDCIMEATNGLLVNDRSPVGLKLAVVGTPTPSEGVVMVNRDGSFDWTPPNLTFSGTVTFNYTVQDSAGKQATATVTIVVPAPGQLVAEDDLYACAFGQDCKVPAAEGLLANDAPAAGETLAVVDSPIASSGAVAVNADGSFDWTPPSSTFSGNVTFTYTAEDAVGNQATATVTLIVPAPAGPIAEDDFYMCTFSLKCIVPADEGILANDSSPAGLSLTLISADPLPPSKGTVVVNSDGSLEWTPPSRTFSGTVSFNYTVEDAAGNQATATVTIVVPAPAPLKPVVIHYTGVYSQDVNGPQSLLDNMTSPNGLPLTVVGFTSKPNPRTVGDVVLSPDGTYAFTPVPGWFGTTRFCANVTDGAASATACVTITISEPKPLVAQDDWYTAALDAPFSPGAAELLLANDSSPNANHFLEVTSNGPLSDASAGTLSSVGRDGSFTFTPAAGWTGTVTFSYTIIDDTNLTATAVAHITIPAQPLPVAVDDVYTCVLGEACQVVDTAAGLLGNDSSPTNTPLVVVSVGTSPSGTFNWKPDGTFEFVPDDPNFSGTVTVTYTIKDDFGTSTATLTIVIPDPGLPEMAYNYTAPYNQTFTGPQSLLTGLHSPRANARWAVLGLLSKPPVSAGEVEVYPNGTFIFTPSPGWYGETQFCANVTDGYATTPVCVKLVVPRPSQLPAGDDWFTTGYNTRLVIRLPKSILANDGPANIGGNLSFMAVTVGIPASDGKLDWIKPDGTFQFTPKRGFRGNATFTYTVTDGIATGLGTAVVTIFVAAPKALVAMDDSYVAAFNTPFFPPAGQSLLANDSSPNAGPQLEVVSNGPLSTPSAGTLSNVSTDGNFTFTPSTGWTGTASFNYTITDKGTGLHAVAVVHIMIPARPPPVAEPDTYACPYQADCVVPAPGVLQNDSSPDGGTLQVVGQPTPSVGTLVMQPDGSFTYAPPQGFSGDATFTYTITDGVSPATGAALVTLVIPEPPILIVPTNYSFQTPYETPTDSTQTSNLLADIISSNPNKQMKLSVKAIKKRPLPSEGNVTVLPDGTYTFVPAPGFSGVTSFCVQIVDELSGGEAELCVKIVVPRDETVRFFIPLEPATPDKDAACPDDATLAQLAADYGATVKAQPGVLDLKVLGVTCTWINSQKVLVKIETMLIAKDSPARANILTAINSPTSVAEPQPAPGLCASAVTSSLCGKPYGTVKVLGGCATIKSNAYCIPPELAKCVQRVSVGAFVTAHGPVPGANVTAQTIPRPTKAKVAQFEGCCVPPNQPPTGSTCKLVRVGKKYQKPAGSKTLPQNPLTQINNCECFNLREYVQWDMFTRPNHWKPQHVLAAYPFTAGVATKMCVSKAKAGKKPKAPAHNTTKPAKPPAKPAACVNSWQNVGSVVVSCSAGELVLSATEERGFVMGELFDVVATCGNSAFTSQSSCTIANGANTTVTRGASGTEVTSSEWDADCVCKDTRRRPVIKLVINDVIAGAACEV